MIFAYISRKYLNSVSAMFQISNAPPPPTPATRSGSAHTVSNEKHVSRDMFRPCQSCSPDDYQQQCPTPSEHRLVRVVGVNSIPLRGFPQPPAARPQSADSADSQLAQTTPCTAPQMTSSVRPVSMTSSARDVSSASPSATGGTEGRRAARRGGGGTEGRGRGRRAAHTANKHFPCGGGGGAVPTIGRCFRSGPKCVPFSAPPPPS